MKKIIVISGLLAAMVTAALVFTFCTKETDTEKVTENGSRSGKMHKVAPYCYPPSQSVQLTLSSGKCINVCVDCTDFRDGLIETCFNLCDIQYSDPNCQPYPYGTCCPYPLHIEYRGPRPATIAYLRNPYYWRWAQTEWGNCTCINNLPSEVSAGELIQIVGMPQLAFCFQ